MENTQNQQLQDEVLRLQARVAELERSQRELLVNQQKHHRQIEELEEILAFANLIIYVHDRDNKFSYVNIPSASALGFNQTDMIGKHWRELGLSAQIMEVVDRQRAEVFATGRPATYETKYPTANGIQEYEYNLNPIFDPYGKVKLVISVGRNITTQKTAQNSLRQSEERFAKIFDTIPLPTHISTLAEARFMAMNPASLARYNISLEDVIGRTPVELGWITQEALTQYLEMVKKQGRVSNMESGIRVGDGQAGYGLVSTEIIELDGQACILTMAQDITKLKQAEAALRQSEERFSKIFNFAPITTVIADLDGRLVMVNEAVLRRRQVKLEDVVGHSLSELGWGSLDEQDKLLEVVRRNGSVENLEMKVNNPDANPDYFLVSTELIELDGQTRILIVAQDITERKKAEEALKRSQTQLLQAQKMESIGRVAGGVAHDFNNLLTAISGYNALAMMNLKPDSEILPDLEEIQKAVERAGALTRQLLAYSRQSVLELKVINLNEVVSNIGKMLRRIIGEDIDLTTRLAPNLGQVMVDPGQLEQVIMNLVVNSRDAMPDGGSLVLETRNIEVNESYRTSHNPNIKTGPYVLLAVTDSGYGMDEATQARIFDPFYTTKEPGQGTGLGLSLVYGIVNQFGGFINVYSELGVATTFKIYLPRHSDDIAPVEIAQLPETVTLSGHETILLVEDDETLRNLSSRVLESFGYTVLSAANGKEGLELNLWYNGTIDLLITDMIMPQMGGFELVNQIGVARPSLKIMIMSGYTDQMLSNLEHIPQFKAFLQKPFTPIEFAQKVREVLDSPDS